MNWPGLTKICFKWFEDTSWLWYHGVSFIMVAADLLQTKWWLIESCHNDGSMYGPLDHWSLFNDGVYGPPPAQKKKQWMMPFILLKGALTQKNVPGVIFFSDPIFFAQSFPVTIFYFADFTDTDLRCRWPYILTDVREKHHEVRQLDFREQGNSNPGEFGVKIVATWFYFVSGKFECKVL